MKVGVPKETAAGETRVALVPEIVRKLAAKDFEVVGGAGAGEGSMLADAVYEEAGATISDDVWTADVVVKVAAPSDDEIAEARRRHRPDRLPRPALEPEDDAGARRRRRDGLRDGGDPAHLARAVDGRAVLAVQRRRLQVRPRRDEPPRPVPADDDDRRRHGSAAKVLVLGAGVAGLQAIATARRLGAQVTGYDVRAVAPSRSSRSARSSSSSRPARAPRARVATRAS